MKRLLWYLIAGTKGGFNRARIIKSLQERPYNANQLAEKLNLDYKTIRHHIKVLEDNNIIVSSGDKYGTLYFISSDMENNLSVFDEIWKRIKD
jgi:predicted transcriptional regulator